MYLDNEDRATINSNVDPETLYVAGLRAGMIRASKICEHRQAWACSCDKCVEDRYLVDAIRRELKCD